MMSFSKRFIPLIKAQFSTIKIKLDWDSIINLKSKLPQQMHKSKTVIGLSSAFTLCAGIGIYNGYLVFARESTLDNEKIPQLKSESCIDISTCKQCLHDNVQKSNSPVSEKCRRLDDDLASAISLSRSDLEDVMRVSGTPGITVCVSLNGKILWSEGMGLADVEQMVKCEGSTIMRIASISKSLTMTAVAKLMEQGKINIEEPVQTYVPKYPTPIFKGKEVIIKIKHLLCHTSGIRHYTLYHGDEKKPKKKDVPEIDLIDHGKSADERVKQKKEVVKTFICKLNNDDDEKNKDDKFNVEEYLLKENFSSVDEAIQLFQHDELLSQPGSQFNYTTHGWTLVSAVIESAAGKKFEKIMNQIFSEMGLNYTYFEMNKTIIKKRAKQYVRTSNGTLENAAYVDNSYKYAGGGFLSNVEDLVKFGNVMLYSYQNVHNDTSSPKGYIQKHTMNKMWSPSPGTKRTSSKSRYGLGWCVLKEEVAAGMCPIQPLFIWHTGGAKGGSSVLLISPENLPDKQAGLPQGVVVAILSNLESVNLLEAAQNISLHFSNASKLSGAPKHSIYTTNGQVL